VILQHESTIELDGKVVATASRGGSYDVSPGEHTVKIVAAGHEALDRTISVEPGGAAVVRIVDDPAATAGSAAAPAESAPPAGSATE
jgi:hypothetical protein